MLITSGSPALSEFRIQKLMVQLQASIPALTAINTQFMHFSKLSEDLSAEQHQVLVCAAV